ncbi:MAG: ATP-binding protein [Coriobacteriia bacterium]
MPAGRRGSIRLWQTGLFVAVVVVAMLILSGSLSAGVKATLSRMTETNELRNASALAQRLKPEFPLGVAGTRTVRDVVSEYRDIYGGGIWVYDSKGTLLEASFDTAPLDAVLESARIHGLSDTTPYVTSDIRPNGWIVAAQPLLGRDGSLQGVAVTASPADSAATILKAVRDRLWVTFWVSLAVAGLLGFGFSELIARRMRALSDAAAAIEGGDFDQHLTVRLVPYEIQDLAESYNSMAAKLGEAFASIEENRQQIAAVVESMAEGVMSFDSTGVIRVVNPEAARLLSIDAAEVAGSKVQDILAGSDVIEVTQEALAGQNAARTVTLGSRVVTLNCNPLLGPTGTLDGAVLLLADITERHRLEDAQRRFVADASHEMRTPIAALKGMLELLIDGAVDKPTVRNDFLQTMQAEVDRLGRLVSDLLTLARLEAGNLQLQPRPEYVADLFGDVIGVMRTLAEQADVSLVVELPDDDIRVLADRDRVVQVLLSFTDNALKHSPDGTTIHLGAIRTGRDVRLEVSDEGPGIEPEEIARVFERFYRVDSARAGGGGTGLGLAIAKEIVEAHGSHIDVRSNPGSGTTFAFDLHAGA